MNIQNLSEALNL